MVAAKSPKSSATLVGKQQSDDKEKKTKTSKAKTASQLEKLFADAKSAYSDLDTSEGRKLRKRPPYVAPLVAAKKVRASGTKKAKK